MDDEWFKALADTEEEGSAMHEEYRSKMRRHSKDDMFGHLGGG